MQAAPLARWRWAGCGSPPPPPLRGGGTVPLAALLPLGLLLLLGLPQGRPAQTPARSLLLSPRRLSLPPPAPPSLEAAEAVLEAEALAEEAALEEEALAEGEAALEAGAVMAAKRQQHQFDDYGHMRFGKRTPEVGASEKSSTGTQQQQQSSFPQRTVFRRRPPTQLRVRKFDDYGHMRFGRSEK